MNGIKYPLDTNIVIGLLTGYAPAIALAEECGLPLDKAAVSSITRIELLGYPNLTTVEESSIQAFLTVCQTCPLDERVEAETIRLRRIGSFKLPDAIIAATAIVEGLRLLTLDLDMGRKLKELGYGG